MQGQSDIADAFQGGPRPLGCVPTAFVDGTYHHKVRGTGRRWLGGVNRRGLGERMYQRRAIDKLGIAFPVAILHAFAHDKYMLCTLEDPGLEPASKASCQPFGILNIQIEKIGVEAGVRQISR